MTTPDPTPLRAVYNGAGRDAMSIIGSTMDAYPQLRDELRRAGLESAVEMLVTSVAHKAQTVALADLLEYLEPVLSSAFAGHPDLQDDFDALRLGLVRERDELTRR